MPALAANVSMLYTEHAFLDRFAAAAADGFEAVEMLFPYEVPAAAIATRIQDAGLTLALFNTPPGDWIAGERGTASIPGREAEFRGSVDVALSYAAVMGTTRLHVMAGRIAPGDDRPRHRATYVENLAYAASQAAPHGITIMIEPINLRDMPGYFLNLQEDGAAIGREVGVSNIKLQFDLYHAQIMQGDVATRLRNLIGVIGHVQVAGVPDRHEPDQGELHCRYLLDLLDELGYEGWVGCEYRPLAGTSAGLDWARSWLRRSP